MREVQFTIGKMVRTIPVHTEQVEDIEQWRLA